MILTTPAQDRDKPLSCPHPACTQFHRVGAGNMAHRSWTGKHKHIERLRCTSCGQEFSEWTGTLMARRQLPKETVEQVLQCQRWGVCDAGTADLCGVALKTGHRLQQVAARRATRHHCQVVQAVDVPGVPLDEAHSTLRPKQVEWVHTALAMGSWFLLWVDCGPRTQERAAPLIAQVVARVRQVPVFLTEGWQAYPAALLQVVGIVYRPRRRGTVGRQPKPRLAAPQDLFYAQVIKVRDRAGRVVEVSTRGLRRAAPLVPAVAPAAVGGDDADGLYGAVVWDAAGIGRPFATPHSRPLLVSSPTSGAYLVAGQPL